MAEDAIRRLAEAIRNSRYSLGEIAEKTGISKSMIHKYAHEQVRDLPLDKVQTIARVLGIHAEDIIGWTRVQNVYPVENRRVPILGDIGAGNPLECNMEYDTVEIDGHGDFAVRCEGDSMQPTVQIGELVICNAQEDVVDGEIAVVIIDSAATLKRVLHVPGGVMLISDNPAYEPVRTTEARIIGRAVRVERKL